MVLYLIQVTDFCIQEGEKFNIAVIEVWFDWSTGIETVIGSLPVVSAVASLGRMNKFGVAVWESGDWKQELFNTSGNFLDGTLFCLLLGCCGCGRLGVRFHRLSVSVSCLKGYGDARPLLGEF